MHRYLDLRILIDESMPYAHDLFSRFGKVKTISGRQISQAELYDINALMVRSVTKVDKNLLVNTPVKFIGTATAGIDHVDTEWLKKAGISFYSAQGCNSIAVVEYVLSALLTLASRDGFSLKERIVGIVGVGNIGRHLKSRLEVLGVRTLLCDPPRADRNENGSFHSLDDLIEQVDVVTFHTPLIRDGPYKTFHLADKVLIDHLKSGSILINTSRGAVVDNIALLKCLEEKKDLSVVLDVWEGEPDLNVDLLKKVDIGTAHIAGHTVEGKTRGTIQLFEAYSTFIGKSEKVEIDSLLPIPKFSCVFSHGEFDEIMLKRLANLVYDICHDDLTLRKPVWLSDRFNKSRKYCLERREWSSLCVMCDYISTAMHLRKIGFNAVYQPRF